MTAAATFDDQLAAWQAWAEAPWGRIRFAVVAETLRRQTEALSPTPRALRVLDVGGGDGRDAVPLAMAGHTVTVVDPAPQWLAEARRRARDAGVPDRVTTSAGCVQQLGDLAGVGDGFDLVLCHFVLHYRPAAAGDVRRLAQSLRPGGRLSVMAPNPAARVLMRLTREGPPAALEEIARADHHSATFGTTARQVTADEVAAEMEEAGLRVVARYGTRIANDLLADDAPKLDPGYFDRLLELELALCDRSPYREIGGLWQVVAERPA